MRNEIVVLDSETIEQIAAGEVIENPSCVVKELVENSIDAGAKHISIELYGGGIDTLTVSDDGVGIAANQVEKAFLPHATSKLRSIGDLSGIRTMGFRGEALSSIASVSRVTLETKTIDDDTGVRAVYEGGKKISVSSCGAVDGTMIMMEDLFYNTPARKKFLRTPQTEGSYAASVIEHMALCNPDISFTLTLNGREKLYTSGNGYLSDVIYKIYGREVSGNLIEIEKETPHMKVTGFLGKPVITRGSRALENYFINKRYIRSNIINKAIDDAYRKFMMLHQFPFTCLLIDIDPEYTDVNVHPRKMEIKFVEGGKIYGELFELIKEALAGKDMVPKEADVDVYEKTLTREETKYAPYERRKLERLVKELDEASPYRRIYETIKPGEEVIREEISPLMVREEQVSFSDISKDFREEVNQNNISMVGQVFDTYWIAQSGDEMYIIDQHAAHEKILFERNLKRFRERSFYSQELKPAVIITLDSLEKSTLDGNMEYFKQLGFEIEDFGERDVALYAVPDNLYGISYESFMRECLELLRLDREKETESVWHRIATASCKAAIKGNMRKSDTEALLLIRELMTLEDPYHCPHGRPTIYSMTKTDIEKKFKRIV